MGNKKMWRTISLELNFFLKKIKKNPNEQIKEKTIF